MVLGRYRLEERLGAGGFGVVWRGHDLKLERDVAVKVVPRERGEPGRAGREALAAARLNHPGIVALYELGSDDHDTFLVSELVNGRDGGGAGRRGRDVGPRRGPDRAGHERRAGARARARGDPPRREARQRDGPRRARRRGRLRQAHRLRRRAPGQRRWRDGHRRRGGHAGLHGSGAGRGPRRDRCLRRLLAGAGALRGLDRLQPDPRAEPGGHGPPCRARRCRSLRSRRARPAAGAVRGRGRGAGPGSPLPPASRRAAPGAPGGGVRALRRGRPGGARDARALRHHRCPRPAPAWAPCCTEPDPAADSSGRAGARAVGSASGPGCSPGAGAGVLVLAALESLGPDPAVLPRDGGARHGAWRWRCLPRLGWLVAAAGVCLWLAFPEAGRPGTAADPGSGARWPCPCCFRERGCCGRCRRWPPCSGRSPWRRCSWRWPGWRPRRGAVRASRRRASSGWPWPRS